MGVEQQSNGKWLAGIRTKFHGVITRVEGLVEGVLTGGEPRN
ncbi:hypothetical protein Holit_03058 [Hollandina sp. SP2]